MAGADPIAMDAVAARSMGLNPRDLDILLWGRAKGWGQIEPERTRIVGNRLEDVQTDLMHPVEYTNYTAGYYYGRGNRRWLINGPFDGADLNVDHLGNEAQANPAAGDDAGAGALWRPHQAAASYVDLWQMYQGDLDEATVYAFTRAYSDRDQRGELWVGATKGIAVYVNGELVVSERTTGGHAWKGVTHPIQLVAGDNRILVKVTHVMGRDFGFSLALVDDGLNSERTHYIPHAGAHELGEPIAFTDETRRKFFGGDTLPGLRYHVSKGVATAIETSLATRPERPALHPAYPNPFNAATVLSFDMPTTADARLIIYDTLGRMVRTLADGTQSAGTHTATWDGRDDAGRAVASGIYIARITMGSMGQSQRMALVR
ncbi:MAG: T9SS type A sorting domain-containing protein [Gemmatimonadetes bacterium]|nr:T9SS type A sorting domain-containing protein [Gemmatimonadota bacterium]